MTTDSAGALGAREDRIHIPGGLGNSPGRWRLLGTLPGKPMGSWDTLRVRPEEGPEPRWEPAAGSCQGLLCGPRKLCHPPPLARSPPLPALGESNAKGDLLVRCLLWAIEVGHPQVGYPGCQTRAASPQPQALASRGMRSSWGGYEAQTSWRDSQGSVSDPPPRAEAAKPAALTLG